jgi:hypothetical protein
MNWRIDFRLLDPWIHPEDMMTAIHAHLDESRKNRQHRISEEVIIEDLFIETLINHWPPNRQQKEKLIELLSDKNFCERLSRALVEGRSETWDKIDFSILQNWREIHLKPEVEAKLGGKLPGIQDWSPKAAAAFFANEGVKNKEGGDCREDWFIQRRKRLGLAGKKRYQIKDFTVDNGDPRITR